ncbi:kinase-like domain-containing protein [Mycena filopes]|nr:kinase-like domain-containing protein [Mycena filopes]
MLQQSNDEPSQALDDFREFASDSKSLISDLSQYYSDLDRLFNFLRPLIKKDADSSHAISTEVHYNIADDITTIIDDLTIILRIPESSREFIASRGPEAQALLDLLQDLLDQDSVSEYKPLISKTLLRLSLASSKHPRCFPLTGLETVGGQIAGGGFGDIWKGLVGGQSVSVKIMRVFEDQDIALALKEFSREAIIWRQLCHPNLLPFFGLFYREKRLCLASPWMENGNIMQYLIKHPGVARLPLILDVALGLQYLHEENIVHGDLKAINILVTPSGRACICDFGLSSIVNEITLRLHTTVIERGGTARYWAPELLDPDVTNKCHFGSDVYAFACMCYEVWTGNAPFYEVKEMAVMLRVLRGARPSRPASCTGTSELDALWKLLQDCWEAEAAKRPTAPKIVERLVGPSIGATTTSSTTDWDDQLTSRFRRSLQARPLLPSVAQIEALLFGDEVAQACVECKEGSPSPQPVA